MQDIKNVLLSLKEMNINNERMRKIEININDINNIISNLEKNVNQEKKVLDKFESEKHDILQKSKAVELDIKTYEGKVKDLNTKKFQVKTQHEMEAMVKEIINFKKTISNLEDSFYAADEQLKELNDKIKKHSELVKKAETNLNDKKEQLMHNISTYEKEHNELKDKNSEINKKLYEADTKNPEVLKVKKTLESLTKKRGGLVLSNISKSGNCEICGFNIPPQLINEVREFKKLYQCPACSRILCVNDGE